MNAFGSAYAIAKAINQVGPEKQTTHPSPLLAQKFNDILRAAKEEKKDFPGWAWPPEIPVRPISGGGQHVDLSLFDLEVFAKMICAVYGSDF